MIVQEIRVGQDKHAIACAVFFKRCVGGQRATAQYHRIGCAYDRIAALLAEHLSGIEPGAERGTIRGAIAEFGKRRSPVDKVRCTPAGDFLKRVRDLAGFDQQHRVRDPGEAHAAALASYGKNLGLAFQIVDDALDYGGTTSVIGKAVGDDFREGKSTLPVIIARRRGSAEDQAFWDRALNIDTQEEADLAHAIHLIRSTGAAEATVIEAQAYADLAKAALRSLPSGAWRDALSDLADFCVSRVH